MSRPESWETIARALGARMANHAYCPEDHHPRTPATCPFCADLAAYERYVARAGRPAPIRGGTVAVHDVLGTAPVETVKSPPPEPQVDESGMKPCPGCGARIADRRLCCDPCWDRVPTNMPGFRRWRSSVRLARQVNDWHTLEGIFNAVRAWLVEHYRARVP
jgi:hypothetical protein